MWIAANTSGGGLCTGPLRGPDKEADLVALTPQQPGAASNAKASAQNFKRSHGCSAVATPAPKSGGPRRTIELAAVRSELRKSILKYRTIPAKPVKIRFARWTRSRKVKTTAWQIQER